METPYDFFLRVRHCNATVLEMLNFLEQITDNFNLKKLKLLEIDFHVFYYPLKEDFLDNYTEVQKREAIEYCLERNRPVPEISLLFRSSMNIPKNAIYPDYEQLLYPMEFYCCREFLGLIEGEIDKHNIGSIQNIQSSSLRKKETRKENIKSDESFEDIFIVQDWDKYITALGDCKPPLLDKNRNFIGNPHKHKGVVCKWIKVLQLNGKIKSDVPRRVLALILNNEIDCLKLSADGKTLDNESKVYNRSFKQQLEKIFR